MFEAFFPIMGRTLPKSITLNSCCPVHSLTTTSPHSNSWFQPPASLTSPEAGAHNPSLEVGVPDPWHPSYSLLKFHQQPAMPPPPPFESQLCRTPPPKLLVPITLRSGSSFQQLLSLCHLCLFFQSSHIKSSYWCLSLFSWQDSDHYTTIFISFVHSIRYLLASPMLLPTVGDTAAYGWWRDWTRGKMPKYSLFLPEMVCMDSHHPESSTPCLSESPWEFCKHTDAGSYIWVTHSESSGVKLGSYRF